jgi:protein-tyrosine phosphatase
MDGTAAMIDLIIDGIFVSDAASVIGGRGKEKMKDLRISRVLTISAMEIRETDRIPGIEYKFIFAMDTATQDILGNNILEGAIEYIERAVKDGANVLVHCELGVSRSVAVIIGYLMRRFEWSAKKALVYVQRTRPIASPNSSFMHQLIIFEHLGYKADTDTLTSSPLYRNFCADTGNVPITMTSYRTSSTSSKPKADVVRADLESSSDSATKRYTCRKCRNALFYDIHVMRHKRGGGPLADGVNLKEEVSMDDRCEYEYLITPMKWMQLSEYQGKVVFFASP